MKKKRFLTIFLCCIIILVSIVVIKRLVASPEEKLIYEMRAILNSYITPSITSIYDFDKYYFKCGYYDSDDNEHYSLLIWTKEDFKSVMTDIASLCNDIRNCVNYNQNVSKENIEIQIWIENKVNWSISLYPMENQIKIGLDYHEHIFAKDALEFCKEFDEIIIGGYHGGEIFISDDIDSEYFSDFKNLKYLYFSDLSLENDADEIRERLSNLEGVEVVIE